MAIVQEASSAEVTLAHGARDVLQSQLAVAEQHAANHFAGAQVAQLAPREPLDAEGAVPEGRLVQAPLRVGDVEAEDAAKQIRVALAIDRSQQPAEAHVADAELALALRGV